MGRRLPILRPDAGLDFPPVETASPEGLLAVGGDLRPERLLAAYRRGIFPWYSDGQPILWWSPDPRAVLFPEKLKISRSLHKTLRAGKIPRHVRSAFPRRDAGVRLAAFKGPRGRHLDHGRHDRGLYGTAPARPCAFGRGLARHGARRRTLWRGTRRCVFRRVHVRARNRCLKVAFVRLVRQLARWGYTLIDCQLYTAHLARFGAEEIPRSTFLHLLAQAQALPGRRGCWMFETNGQD